ncbi:phage virion morphogenesis protein [Janthinobacterium sp. GB4P2]|uniref:phage virion morphogenesis protein n=1 Tax=Janthinobacterium sp. GB4P2 TaxID=3424189 RepID=UPI003F233079
MFAKIPTAKYLKVKVTGDQIQVGFFGWVARVAHVHQYGRQERVTKKGPAYKYPARPLLGLTETDRALIRSSFLRHISVGE